MVTMTTLTSGSSSLMARVVSRPLMPGMRTSIRARSGRRRRQRANASWPSGASATTSRPGAPVSMLRRPARASSWSSTISTRADRSAAPALGACGGVGVASDGWGILSVVFIGGALRVSHTLGSCCTDCTDGSADRYTGAPRMDGQGAGVGLNHMVGVLGGSEARLGMRGGRLVRGGQGNFGADVCAGPRSAFEGEGAAEEGDAILHLVQTDMPDGIGGARRGGIEAAAIVAHLKAHRMGRAGQGEARARGARVLKGSAGGFEGDAAEG